jgi:hypothetical protein
MLTHLPGFDFDEDNISGFTVTRYLRGGAVERRNQTKLIN